MITVLLRSIQQLFVSLKFTTWNISKCYLVCAKEYQALFWKPLKSWKKADL